MHREHGVVGLRLHNGGAHGELFEAHEDADGGADEEEAQQADQIEDADTFVVGGQNPREQTFSAPLEIAGLCIQNVCGHRTHDDIPSVRRRPLNSTTAANTAAPSSVAEPAIRVMFMTYL